MKTQENQKIEYKEDFSIIIRLLKWVLLFFVFLIVFSFVFIKSYADNQEKNEIDLITLKHNCYKTAPCLYNNSLVSFNLNPDNSVRNIIYSVNYLNDKSCALAADNLSDLFENHNFFPVNTKSKLKGLHTLDNGVSYLIDLNCVGKVLELTINELE